MNDIDTVRYIEGASNKWTYSGIVPVSLYRQENPEITTLQSRIKELEALVLAQAKRIAQQSELLSKAAERMETDNETAKHYRYSNGFD